MGKMYSLTPPRGTLVVANGRGCRLGTRIKSALHSSEISSVYQIHTTEAHARTKMSLGMYFSCPWSKAICGIR